MKAARQTARRPRRATERPAGCPRLRRQTKRRVARAGSLVVAWQGSGGSRGWCVWRRGARAMPPAVAGPPVPCRQRLADVAASRGCARRSRAPWVALDPAAAKDNDQQQPDGRNVRGCVGAHHARDGERKEGRGGGGRQRWIGWDSVGRDGRRRAALRRQSRASRRSRRRRRGHDCADRDGVILLASGYPAAMKKGEKSSINSEL